MQTTKASTHFGTHSTASSVAVGAGSPGGPDARAWHGPLFVHLEPAPAGGRLRSIKIAGQAARIGRQESSLTRHQTCSFQAGAGGGGNGAGLPAAGHAGGGGRRGAGVAAAAGAAGGRRRRGMFVELLGLFDVELLGLRVVVNRSSFSCPARELTPDTKCPSRLVPAVMGQVPVPPRCRPSCCPRTRPTPCTMTERTCGRCWPTPACCRRTEVSSSGAPAAGDDGSHHSSIGSGGVTSGADEQGQTGMRGTDSFRSGRGFIRRHERSMLFSSDSAS